MSRRDPPRRSALQERPGPRLPKYTAAASLPEARRQEDVVAQRLGKVLFIYGRVNHLPTDGLSFRARPSASIDRPSYEITQYAQ